MVRNATNKLLQNAKKLKSDEFYTQLSDIESELQHYKSHFENKVVYCNCDDHRISNFFKYFAANPIYIDDWETGVFSAIAEQLTGFASSDDIIRITRRFWPGFFSPSQFATNLLKNIPSQHRIFPYPLVELGKMDIRKLIYIP